MLDRGLVEITTATVEQGYLVGVRPKSEHFAGTAYPTVQSVVHCITAKECLEGYEVFSRVSKFNLVSSPLRKWWTLGAGSPSRSASDGDSISSP